jgi:hypothetical protein
MREIVCTRWFIGRCVVLCVQVKLGGSLAGDEYISWVVVVGESASALVDRSVCVEVV